MSPILAPLWQERRTLAPLGLALLLTFAYFVAAPGWNQNSRLALTRALVERGSTIIDQDHWTTGDKSFREGHFYSDKAPGTSMLAAVPYSIFYGIRRLTGGELPRISVYPMDPLDRVANTQIAPEDRQPGDRLVYNQAYRVALYLCGLFAVTLPSLLGAAALYLLAYSQLQRTRPATWIALAYALGTPAFAYSTALYGHQLCAALSITGFALVALPQRDANRSIAVPALSGLCLGLAVMTEYPAAIVTICVTALSAWKHGPRFSAWVIAGGVPCAAALAAYHWIAFGSPWATGYDFVYRPEFAAGMRVNYGIGPPDPLAALQIGFGSYRGLFYLSPALLLATWGIIWATATSGRPTRPALGCATAIVAAYYCLGAGYYMWDGGAAVGPRHLVPALPFLALGWGYCWTRVPGAFRILAAVSIAQMVIATAGSTEAAQHGNPLWEFALPRLLEGRPGPEIVATNLGSMLGLPGVFSLAPLVGLWVWIWPTLPDKPRESPPTTAGDGGPPATKPAD